MYNDKTAAVPSNNEKNNGKYLNYYHYQTSCSLINASETDLDQNTVPQLFKKVSNLISFGFLE